MSANGFAGSVANPNTTPAITLSTTVTGILQGNGTAISAASTSGTGSVALTISPVFTTPNIGTATGSASLNVLTASLGNLTDAGTDGIVVTGGTGSVVGSVSLAQHVADSTHNGYLSSSDWSTFNAKGSGSVTAVSVASANGFAGSSSGGATPALTLSTSVTGILQGNGTAISAATTTGSGSVVLATSPTLVTPALGTPTALVGTNISGTASSLTAGNVTTNANLTGDVTSVGNATTLTNAPVIAKVLTGYTSGAGTVAASDSILQAIQKLNGNDATNANLTGPITSVGNATSVTNLAITNAMIAATTIDLTAKVTGTLPIANGGSNNSTLAVSAGGVVYTDGTRLQNTGAGTARQVLTSNGSSAPGFATPLLPTQQILAFNKTTFTGAVTNGSTTVTSVSSFTGLYIGMGLSANANLTAGTYITALNSGGSTLTLSAAATGGSATTVTFTPYNSVSSNFLTGVYVTPSPTPAYLKITVIGGGGGSVAGVNSAGGGGASGGGSGGASIYYINNPASTYAFQVGGGGAVGVAGTTSSFNATAQATGGAPGSITSNTNGAAGGAGGVGSGGTINLTGNAGGSGCIGVAGTANGTGGCGGSGPSEYGGGGGLGGCNGVAGGVGGNYGGGAGGGAGGNTAGAAAGPGVVIVNEFY